MKRTTILGLNRIRFFEIIRENGVLLAVTFLFICGIFIGALLFRYFPVFDALSKNVFENFLSVRRDGTFLKIFLFSFLSSVLYSGVIYISGTSVVGTVLAPCVVFLRGFESGLICAYLYSCYALMGIAFNAIIFIPCSIISVFSIILFSREATYFSLHLAKLFTPKGTTVSIYSDFKKYCSKFLMYLLLFLLSSMVDAAMSVWLVDFFKF